MVELTGKNMEYLAIEISIELIRKIQKGVLFYEGKVKMQFAKLKLPGKQILLTKKQRKTKQSNNKACAFVCSMCPFHH